MTRLKVKVGATELGENQIRRFECAYQVNEIPSLTIAIRDGNSSEQTFELADSDDFAPGKEITVNGGTDDAKHLLFSGIVTQSCVCLDAGNTELVLTAKGKAVNLIDHPVNLVVNEEIEDEALIKKVVSLSGTYSFKDVATLAKNKIKHPQFAAYQQTPWRIIFARMIENGAVFSPATDGDSLVNLAELTPEAVAEPFALHEIVECQLRVDTQSIIKEQSASAWDIKTQDLITAKAAAKKNLKVWDKADAVLGRKALDLTFCESLSQQQLQARAQGEASYRLLDQSQGWLTVTQHSVDKVAKVKLLSKLKVKGMGEKFAEDNLVTGIRHRFSASNWFIDLEFGLSLNKTLYSPAACPSPMPDTMAKVAEFQAYDKLSNTLPVVIPAIDKATPLYARLTTPFAGNEEGFFFPPAMDTEVLISFLGGNPSYPIIVGACHNEVHKPPFAYDEENLKRGLFVALEEEQLSFLIDSENKIMSLSVTKDDPVSVEISTESVVMTSKDKQMLTLADTTAFEGDNDVTITTKGNIALEAKGDVTVDSKGNVEIKATATEIK